jgi:hypothetical protein
MRLRERLRPLGREPLVVLVPLIAAQWLTVLVFALSVQHNRWLFYQGGDQTFFYTSSWVLAHGHIPDSQIGYAWSLVLAPLSAIFGPNFLSALPALILLQTLVLLPIGLLAVYGIGARVGGRIVGYLAAGLWVFAPFLCIPLFIDGYHPKYVDQFLPQAFGLSGLGDFPSTICVLVAGYLFVRALDTRTPGEAILAGIATGFAIGIKPANGLFLVAPVLGFLAARRWRQSLWFAGAVVPPALTLLLWKTRGLGYIPVLTPHPEALAAGPALHLEAPPLAVVVSRYVKVSWHDLHQNFLYMREVFWSVRVIQWAPLAGFVGVARFSFPKALFLGSWLGAYVIVKGGSDAASLEAGTFLRLFMPALPAFVLLVAALPLLLPKLGPRLGHRFQVTSKGLAWRSRPVLAGALAFGVLPLVMLAFFKPFRDETAAKYSASSVFVPVSKEFDLRSVGQQGTVLLQWKVPKGAANAFSVVFRSPAEFRIPKGSPGNFPLVRNGIRCDKPSGAASHCFIEMTQIAALRGNGFAETPAPGRWTYRVGVAANWIDDEQAGDVMMISPPVTIRVT